MQVLVNLLLHCAASTYTNESLLTAAYLLRILGALRFASADIDFFVLFIASEIAKLKICQ